MHRTCAASGRTFEISADDLSFYDRISPLINGKKHPLPPPKLCPEERLRRRVAFRNERNLYKRTCDLTGRSIISSFSPDKPFPVYEYEKWLGDEWNPLDSGRDFNFSKTFFEQFSELQNVVPKQNLFISSDMENCAYCNYGSSSKNCYLCSCPYSSENSMYSWTPAYCTEDVDGYANLFSQHCYECISCENCFEVLWSEYSKNCSSSAFLKDCTGCRNCFGCVNLHHQEYYFLNQPLVKEEYESITNNILGSYEQMSAFQKYYSEYRKQFPCRAARILHSENCTGDLLLNCRDCVECFDLINMQNAKYCFIGGEETSDTYDCNVFGVGTVLCYEHIGLFRGNNCAFGIYNTSDTNCYYCISCSACEHCFGCEGLQRKKYCILNQQYTKEEYEMLLSKIIEHMLKTGEWGEFFPIAISPFAYNETVAQEYFPMTKEEVIKKGWQWTEESVREPENEKKIAAEKLPDQIRDIPDNTLNWTIECMESSKPFRIQELELKFYRKMNLPLPRFHPDTRHRRRIERKNPYQLWDRVCMKCGKGIRTTYAPDRPEMVYCEECYAAAIHS